MHKRLINRKFGTLSDPFLSKLEQLTSPQLEDLVEATLDMQSLADLEQWYAQGRLVIHFNQSLHF